LVHIFSGTILNCAQPGIICRKGPFSKEETQKIHDTIQMYQKVCRTSETRTFFPSCLPISVQENDLDDERLDDLVYSSDPAQGFWSYVGLRLFGLCFLAF